MDIETKREKLLITDRLIVAFDYKPDLVLKHGRKWVRKEVMKLVRKLAKTGITVKLNSVLRALGYDTIDEIHQFALRFFADLKLVDIGNTLTTDGLFLQESVPEILTVYCATGIKAMMAIRPILPMTELLGVTVLTDFDNEESRLIYRRNIPKAVLALAGRGMKAKFDGFVSSGKEATSLRNSFGKEVTLNIPAVRPKFACVVGDDQNKKRVVTPAMAFKAGADRIIVGRPITQAKSPYDAVMRTLDEIYLAVNGQ